MSARLIPLVCTSLKLHDFFSSPCLILTECIAQTTGRPLIALAIADLMLKNNVEQELEKWFSLAEKWRAILLLDEADIFLERRASKDMERNGIVSSQSVWTPFAFALLILFSSLFSLPSKNGVFSWPPLPHDQPHRTNRRRLSLPCLCRASV